METKPAFKLVKTTVRYIKVHGKFFIVIVLLVITTSTDTAISKRKSELAATLKQKLGILVTTAPRLNSVSDDNLKILGHDRGTLLYVSGSCERRSKRAKEMHILLRPIPKEDSLRH